MKWIMLALFIGGMAVSGWEVRRGLVDGKVNFQTGMIERSKSPIFFWLWFVVCCVLLAFFSILSVEWFVGVVRGKI